MSPTFWTILIKGTCLKIELIQMAANVTNKVDLALVGGTIIAINII